MNIEHLKWHLFVGTHEHHPIIFHLVLFPLEDGGRAAYMETPQHLPPVTHTHTNRDMGLGYSPQQIWKIDHLVKALCNVLQLLLSI